jgi:hypothetical protein
MQAHWDVKDSEMNQAFFTHDRKRGVNTGVAMVVPAVKILETINQEGLVIMRRAEERRATRGMVPGMDSVKPKTNSQPFTKDDFESALKKASRKTTARPKRTS